MCTFLCNTCFIKFTYSLCLIYRSYFADYLEIVETNVVLGETSFTAAGTSGVAAGGAAGDTVENTVRATVGYFASRVALVCGLALSMTAIANIANIYTHTRACYGALTLPVKSEVNAYFFTMVVGIVLAVVGKAL